MVRDEVHGGYGDTSNIPRLAPEEVRGAAAAAALTAVQEVQRQTADLSVVRAALAEELTAQRRAESTAADAVPRASETPEAQAAPIEPQIDEVPVVAPAAVASRTHPIVLPEVDVAELGVADRLGLSDDGTEEVGPTS
jgi:cell division transport system ATP-binding protein